VWKYASRLFFFGGGMAIGAVLTRFIRWTKLLNAGPG